MKILVACEYSGTVRDAFRSRGHDAYSCDIMPCDRGPLHHYQCDVREVLHLPWDLLIGHPPCTYFASSSVWALNDANYERYPGVGYHQKISATTLVGKKRREAQQDGLQLVHDLWNAPIPKKCIENPVGQLSTLWRKPTQIIHPWQFGEDASKATCLWIDGMEPLEPTDIIHKPAWVPCECCDDYLCTIHDTHVHDCNCPDIDTWAKRGIYPYESGGRYANQTKNGQNKLPPGKDRWKERSTTYPGIATAMAEQWGEAKGSSTLHRGQLTIFT